MAWSNLLTTASSIVGGISITTTQGVSGAILTASNGSDDETHGGKPIWLHAKNTITLTNTCIRLPMSPCRLLRPLTCRASLSNFANHVDTAWLKHQLQLPSISLIPNHADTALMAAKVVMEAILKSLNPKWHVPHQKQAVVSAE